MKNPVIALLSILVLCAAQAVDAQADTEAEVETAGPAGALRGTMLAPESPNGAVVLIIPGSGPTSRDGKVRQA